MEPAQSDDRTAERNERWRWRAMRRLVVEDEDDDEVEVEVLSLYPSSSESLAGPRVEARDGGREEASSRGVVAVDDDETATAAGDLVVFD